MEGGAFGPRSGDLLDLGLGFLVAQGRPAARVEPAGITLDRMGFATQQSFDIAAARDPLPAE